MSLLEDVLDLLRSVLEYFGVPPDMLVPVWENQLCGQYRSLVRMIGTNLPLNPSPRVHFQIPLHTYRPHGYVDVTMDTPAIPTFADVLWVAEDEGDSFAKIRNCVRPVRRDTVGLSVGSVTAPPEEMVRARGLAVAQAQRGDMQLGQRSDPEALRKITALEAELLRLQAQIAMIVTAVPPSGPAHSQKAPGTHTLSRPPRPVLTSTPRCPPPPPPPPPPPACPNSSVGTMSVMELVRQRRDTSRSQGKPQGESKAMPSMLDVLKNLNDVKLRAVLRSPGGRPVQKRRSKGPALLSDPAALIAEALKRKFAAHRRLDDSSDKENCSAELSPFGSPEMPCIPQHTRRSLGRLNL